MTLRTTILVAAMGWVLSLGTGCAALGRDACPPKWERRELARGVELLISDDASVDAQRIAEDFQREVRSRDLNARQ
jgi:hypothetical protein